MHVCTSWCLRCDCKAQSVRRHWRWRGRGETGGAPGWCPLQTSSSPSAEKESVRPGLVCRPSILQRRCIFPQRCSSVTQTFGNNKEIYSPQWYDCAIESFCQALQVTNVIFSRHLDRNVIRSSCWLVSSTHLFVTTDLHNFCQLLFIFIFVIRSLH